MLTYSQKIKEVATHLQDGDIDLGYRKLLDCVLDTQNINFYNNCIELTDWKESTQPTNELLITKCLDLLTKLEKQNISHDANNICLLDAVDIEKKYNNGKFKLGKVSLSINKGDVWGLVGENGNGKTTLLRILAKEISYDNGILSYNLKNKSSNNYDLRTKLTYIPQRTSKWYGSLKNNLKFAATHYNIKGNENEALVLMMIIRFGLWNYRLHQWSELSSGYKMRFELARTFLRAPEILLLDEPLANLDVLAQQLILEDLKNLSQSIANPLGIVLSSQQLYEVEKISDKIIFLKNGQPSSLSSLHQTENEVLMVELDIENSRSEINNAIQHLNIKNIHFNGSSYIISFEANNGINDLLTTLIQHKITIKYFRNISKSTRRLFV